MTKYTVKAFAATGKNDPKFGAEYKVVFNEDAREVTLSRKSPVVEGQEENGEIVAGKYGAYFKKDPFVPSQTAANTGAASAGTPAAQPAPKYVPFKKTDNSDGMRQGMCINNAANFVNSLDAPNMDDKEWAKMVHAYATALYRLGDLNAEEEVEEQYEKVDQTMTETLKAIGM